MDIIKNIILELQEANAQVSVDGGNLRIDAGKGLISDRLKLLIRTHKKDLIDYVTSIRQGDYALIPAVAVQEGYVLSSSQRRLWVLSQFEEVNRTFNIPVAYWFEGRVDVAALASSFYTLIERHEILRTVFREDAEGEVRQHVLPADETGFGIAFHDLRRKDDRGAKMQALVQEQLTEPFNLASGPLLRAAVCQVEDDRWAFSYVMHHIISDGWSMGILMKELMLFYNSRTSGHEHALSPLRIQYKDYAAWQQEQLKQEAMQGHRAWWLGQLGGSLPVLQLAGDRPRPAIQTYNGRMISRSIGGGAALRALGQERGGTLFMVLLSAVNVLLYKYGGQEDIIIGSPIAGRDHADLEDQIGFYLNTLTLRTRLGGADSFGDVFERVKATTLGAYEHQSYPFDELVEALDLRRDPSRNVLFDVMVLLQNFNGVGAAGAEGDFRVRKYEEAEQVVSKYDLTFFFNESGEELVLDIEYNTDIFDASTIVRLGDHLNTLLASIAADPDASVDSLNYLPSAERALVVEGFNDTDHDYAKKKTLNGLFEAQVSLRPDAVALMFDSKTFTYSELNAHANQLAHYLRSQYKLKADDLVVVQLERSEWMIISLLAVLKAGAAYVPVDPQYPEERIQYMVEDSGCKAVIHEEELQKFFQQQAQYSTNNIAQFNAPTDLAYVIYTSGSTGKPKGCLLQHQGVVNRLEWMWEHYGFSPEDVILQKTTFTFDVSVWELFLPLCWGARMVLCQREDIAAPERIAQLIEQHGVTCLHFVPGMLQAFISSQFEEKAIADRLQSLRRVITSGEALLPATVQSWYKTVATPLHNLYGPTEASVDVTYFATHPNDIIIPIGRPIWNTQVYITDKQGQPVGIGVVGEINLAGDGLARGYLNRPELTEQKFVANPFQVGTKMYRTGDVGRWLSDGNIEFLGRSDDQVKIRGYRIELGEIETALQQHEAVEAAAVLALSDTSGEKTLVAYVITDATAVDLRHYLGQTLPVYMIPQHFVLVGAMPLTASGKVDRKALAATTLTELKSETEYIAPRTDVERKLAQIWQDILGRENIGVKDSFFDLGGHSLKATRLASQLHKNFEIRPTLGELFARPLLEEQARLIEQGQRAQFQSIQPVTVQEDGYPISSAQQRLWILSQLEEGNIAYNMPGAYRFQGTLDTEALSWCFVTLIERHESLRTLFAPDSQGNLRQYIKAADEIGFILNQYDLRSDADREAAVQARLQEDAVTPFNLVTGPLVRASLYQVEDDQWVLGYVLHHIISDGWSMGLLLKELLLLYNARVQGLPNPLEPLRIHYKDYAAWQQSQLSGASLEQHKRYWLDQFSGELPLLELPGDRPRPAVKSYNGSTTARSLGQELSTSLKTFTHQRGATLYMGLLAGVKALLYRYTGQEDLVVGSPIAGREHSDLEEQIGFYVNMLAVRTQLKGAESFEALLARVRQTTLKAYEHQVYPFDELVEEVHLSGDTSRHALFDVVVVLQNTELEHQLAEARALQGLHVTPYQDTERVVSLFDLRFDFKDIDGALFLVLEYNTDIYSSERIERMADNLLQLLAAAAAEPAKPVNRIDYLGAEEKLLLSAAATPATYPTEATIVSLFEEQVKRTPDNIAISFGADTLTYRELNEQSNRLAHFLINSIKLQQDEGVGILLERGPNCIVAMLGILKAGGGYIPMETDTPEDRLRFMMTDTRMRAVITEKALMEVMNRLQWSIPTLEAYLCIDSNDVHAEQEREENTMMSQELWDHVGEKAVDEITGGGWSSSFTGEAIPADEMEEYAMNAYKKLAPSLHKDMRVLEIGCSSGLTLSKIAPSVALYYGTDMSPVILGNTRKMVQSRGWNNVQLQCLVAHDINQITETGFDLVIINSVIQHFHGHNYLRNVIRDAAALLNNGGRIFVGDVMDMDKKDALIRDLEEFKLANKGKGYTTKTDFSADLFVAQGFFEDLAQDLPGIVGVEFSDKIHTIENELTKYRYDAIIRIAKTKTGEPVQAIGQPRNRYQYSRPVLDAQPSINPGITLAPNGLAYVIYTSGTTGQPKGALIEHRNVVRLLVNDKPLFDFNEHDVWTMFHSYCFDFSVWEMYGALLFGGRLVLVPKVIAQDAAAFRNLLQDEGVTILNQTPSAFYNLVREELEQPEAALGVRCVIFGGEALSPGRLEGWHEKYPRTELINMYGITETTVHVTYKKIGAEEIKANSSSIGKPIPTLYCYVLDQQQQLLPIGVDGELYVGGDGVCRGYLARPELTAKRFIENPFRRGERLYRSGDKARLLSNGELEYGGRIDLQVKIRGYRIELGEIESTLEKHTGIDAAVVVAKTGRDGEKELVAYIVSTESLNASDLAGYLGKTLPAYMLPSRYVPLDKLPLTTNGKVDKKSLPDPEGLGLDTGSVYTAPRNETEEKLVAIWQEVLGRKRVGVKDDFFDLGGHSLKVTRLASQVHKLFDVKLALKDLFTCVVLEDQARFIERAQRTAYMSIDPVALQDDYALSAAQRRLWILSQFREGNVAYNIPGAYVFEGELDKAALSTAFDTLIARHESLRTVFRENESGEVRQMILPASALVIEEHDLRGDSQQEESLKALVEAAFTTTFDLAAGPLLRASLCRLSDDRWVFTYVMHHIVSDGWSMDVLLKELLHVYHAVVDGKPDLLKPLRIQYRDYAAWQEQQLQGESLVRHRNYWLQQFAGELPVLSLVADKPRPASKTYNGVTVLKTLPAELVDRLRSLSGEEGGTLFMGMLAAINVLLYKYSGQEDIITGTQIAGRDHVDLEEQIGIYLNTLPLRARFSGGDSYRSLLAQVRQVTLDAYEHQVYPFDDLLEELDLQRDLSRNALFDVSVVLHNHGPETGRQGRGSKLRVKGYDGVENRTSKFDLAFDLVELDGAVVAGLVYNSDVYAQNTAVRMLDHLEALIAAIASQPDAAIGSIDYLSEPEKERVIKEFNDTQVAYPSNESIASLFEAQAMATPDKTALVFGDKELTYKELDEQANKLAAYLRSEHKVRPDDKVAIMLDRSESLLVAILGVLKSGAAYVPIDVDYPAARKSFILQDTFAQVLITQSDYLFELDYFSGSIFAIDVQLDGLESVSALPVVSKATDLAYVMYTSGSTGNPKGVLVEQRSVVRLVKSSTWLSFSGEEVILSTGAISFDATTFEYWGTLLNGGKLVLCTKDTLLDEQKLAGQIRTNHVDTMWFTSGWFNQLVDKDVSVFEGLKTIVAGGDKLSLQHIQSLRSVYPDVHIINGYGPTENTTFSLTYTIGDTVENSIPVGKPISNSTAYILDAQGNLCPIGVAGEICVGGDGLARGYLNNEELTAQKFITHPVIGRIYKTGDLGRWLEDGNIEFLGRKDEQVKVRGYRIELGEIENALQAHGQVEAAVVIARADATGEKQIIAYLVSPETLAASDLRAFLSRQLPTYMLPDQFVQLDELPLNANGKVDRKALPQPEGLGMKSGVEYIAPRTETESRLAAIWGEILNKGNISVTDNFFEIGGHSLKATRLASQIHREFDVKVELKDIFTKTILEEQAHLIDSAKTDSFQSIALVPEQDDYELSSSQRRLWVLSQFEEGSIAYNMPGVHIFEGDLDHEALSAAFASLIERHEVLRTVFREDAQGDVRQIIRPADQSGFQLELHDLRYANADLSERVEADAARPFDLEQGPLLRASLYQIEDKRWIFTYVLHHIISDGWSMGILIRELLAFYNAKVNGEAPALSPLRIQYKDYAAWQQEQLSGEALAAHRTYWLNQFAGELPVLELPTDHTRPLVKTYNGGALTHTFSADLTKALNDLSQQQGGTLYMTLLAAVNALLYKYSNQNDIIVGSPIAGRQHADLEGQIGFYLNTLALRTHLSGSESFTHLLNDVKQTTLAAYEHQVYPFDQLVDELQLRRDTSRHPLFDVLVILQNAGSHDGTNGQTLQGLTVKNYEGRSHRISKFDWLFDFSQSGDELQLSLEYNSDIYASQMAERMAFHLEVLLETIVSQPKKAIDDLNYLPSAERALVVEGFNDTDHDYAKDKTLNGLFEEQAALRPDAVALVFDNKTFTYSEINAHANQLAHYLRSQYRLKVDDLVVVQLERSEWMIISLLAILKAGAAYVPVDPQYPEERIQYMIEDSGCKAVINDEELARFFEQQAQYSTNNIAQFNKPTDLAYVIYTSGSTGKPKGCLLQHQGVVNRLEWMWTHYGFGHEDVILQKTTFTFDVSVWELFLPLCWGAKMVLCEREDIAAPERIAQLIEKHSVTCLHFVPGMLQAFISSQFEEKAIADRLQSLRRVITSGEALLPATVQSWYKTVTTPLYNLYGPTEASVDVTYYATQANDTLVPIGRPIWNTQVYITDKQGQPVGIGVVGEINLAGDGLARGYLNRPELTEQKFVANPFNPGTKMYRTGDVGRWLSDGNIEFLCRSDDQVKIRGYRIELGEIETALQQHEAVEAAAVLALSDTSGEKTLVAYVITDATAVDLRHYLGQTLPAYMIPLHFVLVDAMPLTASGKVDRKALAATALTELKSETEYIAPRTEIESRLAQIWQDILGRENIGVKDSFFDLGGHSLKATRLIARVRKEFKVEIDLKNIFREPTIEVMADTIVNQTWFGEESEEESYDEVRI